MSLSHSAVARSIASLIRSSSGLLLLSLSFVWGSGAAGDARAPPPHLHRSLLESVGTVRLSDCCLSSMSVSFPSCACKLSILAIIFAICSSFCVRLSSSLLIIVSLSSAALVPTPRATPASTSQAFWLSLSRFRYVTRISSSSADCISMSLIFFFGASHCSGGSGLLLSLLSSSSAWAFSSS